MRFILFLSGCMIAVSLSAEESLPSIISIEKKIEADSERGDVSQVEIHRAILAEQYVTLKQWAEAARQYELILATRPSRKKRMSYSVSLAQMRMNLNDYQAAIRVLEDAVHDQPKHWDVNLMLAGAYAHVQLDERARERYLDCLKMQPDSLEAKVGLAGVYRSLGYVDRSIAMYQEVLALQKSPDAYRGLASAYQQRDDIPKAIEVLEDAQRHESRPEYDVHLGDLWSRKGERIKAIRAWERALSQVADQPEVSLKLAMAYIDEKRFPEADRLLKEQEKHFPESALVQFLWGWYGVAKGDDHLARVALDRVMTLAPTDLVQHYAALLQRTIKHK